MMATESTLSLLLLGIEPMFLMVIYTLWCIKSPPLARRRILVDVRDTGSMYDTTSVINRVTWIVYGVTTPSSLRKSPNSNILT